MVGVLYSGNYGSYEIPTYSNALQWYRVFLTVLASHGHGPRVTQVICEPIELRLKTVARNEITGVLGHNSAL